MRDYEKPHVETYGRVATITEDGWWDDEYGTYNE